MKPKPTPLERLVEVGERIAASLERIAAADEAVARFTLAQVETEEADDRQGARLAARIARDRDRL